MFINLQGLRLASVCDGVGEVAQAALEAAQATMQCVQEEARLPPPAPLSGDLRPAWLE